MTEHPYAQGNTLTPGETAKDDPYSEDKYCPECDENVEPVLNECPLCGMGLE